MCNLYATRKSAAEIGRLFGADHVMGVGTATEFYPRSLAPVVIRDEGERYLHEMRWGFPPPPSGRAPVTNVRNLSSPFWLAALSRPDRRCLVPVTEFCEWQGEPGHKVKRWFSIPSRPIFAFAGVWRPTGDAHAYAFLTCEANPLVAAIHPKAMPVILHEEDYDHWLSAPIEGAVTLAAPYPSQLMAVA